MPKSFQHTSEDFEAFYRRHVQAIYRVCYAFMKNPQDAEDCTEDVFVRAMTAEITFENERHERAWLTTTAMNLCKDKLKSWWKQKVVPTAVTPIRSAARRKWRRYLSLAACLVLIVTAGLTLPQVLPNGADHVPGGSSDIQNPEGNDPPTLAGSPFIEVDGPEDFAELQLSIAAPKGTSEVSYCIAYETTARVDFTLDGHAYTYLAARTDTDISGIDGAVQEILNLTLPNADVKETGVILEWLCIVEDDTPSGTDTGAAGDSDPAASADADAPGIWRASWQTAGVTYCVLNEDGAAEDAVCALVQTLAAQTA